MASNGQKTTANEHQQLQGMDKAAQALSLNDTAAQDDSKGTGTLQLFPCRRQCIVAVGVLQGGGEIALQVVKSKESKAKLDVGWD